MGEHPYQKRPGDPGEYWADYDLIHELEKDGSLLSLRASTTIRWLREVMISPEEYIRVSNERGAAFMEIEALKKS